jgi:hypothetical protein
MASTGITTPPKEQKSFVWWIVVLVFVILVIPFVILAMKITKVLLQLLGYGGSGGGIGGSGISFFDIVLGAIGWKWLSAQFPQSVPFDGTTAPPANAPTNVATENIQPEAENLFEEAIEVIE